MSYKSIVIRELDEIRIDSIRFVIENLQNIGNMMRDHSATTKGEWDPQWPMALSLSYQCTMVARRIYNTTQ